ncbi:MAG: squalene synthase HpnC [Chlorobi bacterium]|nr:squalene synthase HpnC [Chlorobiota bacterium]MCI0716786.1 squalene synthase HpnC [Chlorobiota bacterium]
MQTSLINSSFKYCEDLAKNHYENFPVASFLLPKDKRNYIYSIYAFARGADDFSDEPGIEGGKEKRLALLDEWNGKLKDCFNGKAYDPIFIALVQTVSDCKIPIEPLGNLLNAFRQDVTKSRYETFDEVLGYCKNSANPVGRLVLMIFGCFDSGFFKYSDKICTALQLANFWQDIEIDLKKDRVYLPAEDLSKFDYSYNELLEKRYNDNFKKLMEFEVSRTQEVFDEGKKLIELTANDKNLNKLAKELKLTWLGGTEILKKIKETEYNVFKKRPSISAVDKLKIFLKSRIVK